MSIRHALEDRIQEGGEDGVQCMTEVGGLEQSQVQPTSVLSAGSVSVRGYDEYPCWFSHF